MPFPQIEQGDVWLLVGAGVGDLIFPTETRIGKGDQPNPVKTTFGGHCSDQTQSAPQ